MGRVGGSAVDGKCPAPVGMDKALLILFDKPLVPPSAKEISSIRHLFQNMYLTVLLSPVGFYLKISLDMLGSRET